MKKYYFITYQGQRNDLDPSINIWHNVIDVSPMEYRQKLINCEHNALKNGKTSFYSDFYIINCTRISKQEYEKWKGNF